MSLDDIFDESNPIQDAIDELEFQQHLKKLSELSPEKKKEYEEELKNEEFTLTDLGQIKTYRCIHCKEGFDSDEELGETEKYCPYCKAVCFGEKDGRWIKKVGKGEARRGFNGKP